MPCSTSTSALAAPSIQSVVSPCAIRSNSGSNVDVAHQLGRTGHHQEQVFDQSSQRPQQAYGLFLPIGAPAVPLRGLKQLRIIGFTQRGLQNEERILAAGQISAEIEGQRPSYGALGQSRREPAVHLV